MEQIKLILVDDHEDSLDILHFYIKQLPDFQIIDMCRNGDDLIDSVMTNNPDVILLDINMPKINGIEAIRECLKIKSNLKFIFVTSYDQYAVQAFEISALDYIVKPVDKTRLYSALEKVKTIKQSEVIHEQNRNYHQRLTIKEGLDLYYIPTNDILFIEKVNKKCHIYTTNNTFSTSETIGHLLNQLPCSDFFLSHRSNIINLLKLSHVISVNQTYIAYFYNTDKYAHVSKLKIEELQQRLLNRN